MSLQTDVQATQGKIIAIIGAVVDVEFPHRHIPHIYDALSVEEKGLVLEVQQQLGEGVVRTIAMGTTDGLCRGLTVTNTGNPIIGAPSESRPLVAS